MKKERLKSLLLITLVISSLLLTAQIWFHEKLWPEGYNFFVSMRASAFGRVADLFGQTEEEESDEVSLDLIQPYHLVAYTVKDFDHAALTLTARNPEYLSVSNYAEEAIKGALAQEPKSLLSIDQEEWQRALFTRGLYLDYGTVYHTDTFASLIDAPASPLSATIPQVQKFIITPGDSLTNDVYVYLCDESTGSFYRALSGLNKTELESKLSALAALSSPSNRFSFFLGADTPTGNAGEVVFDSYLVLSEQGEQLPVLESRNPVSRNGNIDIKSHNLSKLLQVFDINPNTVRKYTDVDGNLVFVQNQANLKISPDGVIDYRAVSGKGLKLSESTSFNLPTYLSVAVGANFSNKIIDSLGADEELELTIRSMTEDNGNVKVTLDYVSQGTPIIFTGALQGQNAVTMELEGDYLKSYTQIIRTYSLTDQMHMTQSTYEAVDTLFARLPEEQRRTTVEDMIIAYEDDGSESQKLPDWFIRLQDQNQYQR